MVGHCYQDYEDILIKIYSLLHLKCHKTYKWLFFFVKIIFCIICVKFIPCGTRSFLLIEFVLLEDGTIGSYMTKCLAFEPNQSLLFYCLILLFFLLLFPLRKRLNFLMIKTMSSSSISFSISVVAWRAIPFFFLLWSFLTSSHGWRKIKESKGWVFKSSISWLAGTLGSQEFGKDLKILFNKTTFEYDFFRDLWC